MLTKQRTARRSKPDNPVASPAAKRTSSARQPELPPARPAIDPEVRRQMIACAAYYRAEQRSFPGGSELQDWLEAEAEIDRMLTGSAGTH